MRNVALLYGGKSGEHDVSCVSAASVLANLDPHEYAAILIGIDRDGTWRLQKRGSQSSLDGMSSNEKSKIAMPSLGPIGPGNPVAVIPGKGLFAIDGSANAKKLDCDIVFPVLHGTFGEDGTVQGLLESAGIPYVGAGVLGSAIGMDKDVAKRLWKETGLPIVECIAVRKSDLSKSSCLDTLRRKISARFGWPCFVKPAASGSSVGTSKVSTPDDLESALGQASQWGEKILIERFVEARELECAVLGDESPVAFPPGEVVPTHEFYDFEAKYEDPNGAKLVVPAAISEESAKKIESIAVSAFKACELSGMARVDFFLDKRTGEILLNEVNTIPGFTAISMYPRLCANSGLTYAKLLDSLINLGFEAFRRKSTLRYNYEG